MEDKISIILPIFNVGNHLKEGIDSLINQSIGHENLEIIMVNDCSSDNSGEIIDEYAAKYDCCRAIHFEENSGSPTAPRNRGIEEATGDFIMFLDPDDAYCDDCCETLYAAIVEHDADVAFGRFRRIFTQLDKVQKSYSPFIDELEINYPGEEFQDANPLNISDKLWNGIFKRILYGSENPSNYNRDKPIDEIVIKNICEEIDLLNIPPAVWSKIYRREFLIENNIRFPDFRCGEDMAFSLEVFLKARGIVFLNNYMCCNYYIRDFEDDKSITHDVDLGFLKELMESFIYCSNLTKEFSSEIQSTAIDHHLLYWLNTWKNGSFTKEENKELLKTVNKLKKIHSPTLKSKLILSSISAALQAAICKIGGEKVTVIIPVYNVENYLNRCIDYTVNQTYENLEIILVDDGATDSSGEICDKRALEDSRIKVVHKPNGGLGSARNEGIAASTGNYLLFLDSDDYIELDAVEKLMKEAEKGYDVVCCGFDRVDEQTKQVYSREMISMDFDELEINENTVMQTAFLNPSAWGKLFKREVIEGLWFSEDKGAIEDTLFYLEFIPKTKNIRYVKEILWHYMVRKDSLIMSITEEKADLFESDLLKVKEKYIENDYSKPYFDYLTLEVFIHNCISIPSRLYNNKDVNISKRIKHIKDYMNANFKDWKTLKINVKGNLVKKLGINTIRFMYKVNIFKTFLVLYNFMINKLKIDIKW